jgi:hypothetical protein
LEQGLFPPPRADSHMGTETTLTIHQDPNANDPTAGPNGGSGLGS